MGIMAPQYQSEEDAREYLEYMLWPEGPVCMACGLVNEATKLRREEGTETHGRKGLYQCKGCRKEFTVTVGTIFEDSHIPLCKWLLAYHLLCASKKGMSAHQLHRMLKVTYRSAWFMAHRIRYAMSQEPLSSKLDGIIEVDETYVGGKLRVGSYRKREYFKNRGRKPDYPSVTSNKAAVVSVLQRGGRVQSKHVERVTAE